MFRDFFKKKQTTVTTEKPEVDYRSSDGLARFRQLKASQRRHAIEQAMFIRTHADIVTTDANGEPIATTDSKGEPVAMDSAGSQSQIKSAFSLQQSTLPDVLYCWYASQGFIGYQACSILSQNWLINKACSVPAQDAIKKGYRITINDGSEVSPKVISAMRARDKHFKINQNLVEFEKMNRVFGIRIAIFHVEYEDSTSYEKPFNIDGVKPNSYKGISQVDPYWITPELDSDAAANPSSQGFYEPTWWRVNGKRYHKSHLVITRYSEVGDLLKPSYFYGGLPLTQLIYERAYNAERVANEAPLLALTKRQSIIKTDVIKALANQAATEERIQAFNNFRDNFATLLIDVNEEYQQSDTNLSDLDAVIMTGYQLVASVAQMPATKLLGTSPKGFSATGEYEQQTYYDLLEGIQEDSLTPLLERHYELLVKSEIAPELDTGDFDFEIVWYPLDSPTALETAQINDIKSRTDSQLMQAGGAVEGGDVRRRLISDENSGYDGLKDADLDTEEVAFELGEGEEEPILPRGGEVVEKSPEIDVQEGTLNGAQVKAIVDLNAAVARKEMPRNVAIEIISASFPKLADSAPLLIG